MHSKRRPAPRGEGEAALRDAVLLTAPGDDPVPAGKVLWAFEGVSARKSVISSKFVGELAELLDLSWDERLA
ncbi:DUF1403 family protein [Mesorhizobium sp. KR1-2]|uniref:DUF1403 family protein n=1 Tax=Mesorhizobium sp. KR1-2 TaxID=3156609 RepID=UPI0032B3D401